MVNVCSPSLNLTSCFGHSQRERISFLWRAVGHREASLSIRLFLDMRTIEALFLKIAGTYLRSSPCRRCFNLCSITARQSHCVRLSKWQVELAWDRQFRDVFWAVAVLEVVILQKWKSSEARCHERCWVFFFPTLYCMFSLPDINDFGWGRFLCRGS